MNILRAIGCIVVLTSLGCAGSKKDADSADDANKLRVIESGSRCRVEEGQQQETVDLNQDGTDDVRRVYVELEDGTRILVCREADLDYDGQRDVFVFYDEQGNVLRDEVNLDYKDRVDIVSTYAKGKVVKQEIDTNGDGRVDRVRYLEDGVPVRLEGDTDGDARVDYWEYYQAGKLIRIGVDTNGDGKADSWSRDAKAIPAPEEVEKKEEEKAEEAEEPAQK